MCKNPSSDINSASIKHQMELLCYFSLLYIPGILKMTFIEGFKFILTKHYAIIVNMNITKLHLSLEIPEFRHPLQWNPWMHTNLSQLIYLTNTQMHNMFNILLLLK